MNVYLAFKEKLLASTNSATSFWGLLTRLFLSTNLPQQTVEEIAAGSRPTTSHRRPCWSSICLTFFSIIFCRFVSGRRPDDEGRKFIWWKNWEQVQLNSREICFKTVGPIRSSQMIRSTECGRNRLLPAILFFFFFRCLACSVLNVAIFVLTKTVTRMTKKTNMNGLDVWMLGWR